MSGRPVIGPATAGDFMEYAGQLPPHRVKAWSCKLDGKVIGLGGIMFMPEGGAFAFVDMADEARRFHKTLHQTGLRFMREVAQNQAGTIVATVTTNVPRAAEWLLRLGFVEREANGLRVFVHEARKDRPG